MDDARSEKASVTLYEVVPTGILAVVQRAAAGVGFSVAVSTGPKEVLQGNCGIVVAHCATRAWHELADRAPAGTICLHVSSVRREHVAPPQMTPRLAYLMELVPAISEIIESDWSDLLCGLSASRMDLLVRRPVESPLARFFLTAKTPLILCSLLMLAQAFLDAPAERKSEMAIANWWLNAFSRLPVRQDGSIAAGLKEQIAVEVAGITGKTDLPVVDQFISGLECPGHPVTSDEVERVRLTLDRLLYSE